MNFWGITGIVLSSSFITALVTIAANWLIHKDQYKKEYYKLILQRRLQAYEMIDEYISNLNTVTLLNNDLIHTFLFNQEHFNIILIRMALIKKHDIWISKKLSIKLMEFNVLLVNIDTEINNKTNSIQQIGFNRRENIRKIKDEIYEILKEDFNNLYDIKSFLKSKELNDLHQVEFIKGNTI